MLREKGAVRVTTVVTTATVTADELVEILEARTTPVLERPAPGDPHRFELDIGPFDHYERTVETAPSDDGNIDVTVTTDFKLAIPLWSPLFRGLYKQSFAKVMPEPKPPWWVPPGHIDARASRSLSLLCGYAAFAAYLGVLLSQTNTYFGRDFGSSKSELADALIGVRFGAFLALVVMLFADRVGRRKVLVFSMVAGSVLAATGALAPNLILLGLSQSSSRAFSATVGVLVVIMAAEEMPATARAFAVSMLTMAAALGAGGVVGALQIAELAPWAWRVIFAVPLLFIVPTLRLARSLPETRRFEVHEEMTAAAVVVVKDRTRSHVGRFAVLALGLVLFNIFLAPSSNFLNDFLREEHGYVGWQITLMQVVTSIPGGASIIIGGKLADRYGRKIIGAIGAGAGVVFTTLVFVSAGWSIWVFSFLGTMIGAIAVPALGVYGPELFPTRVRGAAGGGLQLFAVLGAAVGLKFVGVFAGPEHFGSYGEPMMLLGVAPAVLVIVILTLYPETANRELEDLNPEDIAPPHDADALAELDHDYAEHHHLPLPETFPDG